MNLIRIFLTLFLVTFLPLNNSFSAEYKGKNIDGIEYDCSAYSYSTRHYYNVTVEFDGDEAQITFSNGGCITVTLDNEEIDDPNSIDAYDYQNRVYWELDVDGLD